MFHNYLITALRNFTHHKLYSFINISGLTVGLTCAIFIILFVRDQLSYDRWIPDTDNLYRVERTIVMPGARFPGGGITFPLPQAMLEQIPEVRARIRLQRNQVTVLVGNRQFAETMDSVDPNFFQVIKLPLVEGNPASVFAEPNSVVLSETRARKYFGTTPAAGRTIVISASYCEGKLSEGDRHNCNMPSRQDLIGQGLTQQEVEYVDTQLSRPSYYSNQLSEYESFAPKGGRAPSAEGVDGVQERQRARTFGDLPLEVLTAAVTFDIPMISEPGNMAIEDLWRLGHDKLAARSTRGEVIVIPNSHHMIELDQPQAVVTAIRKAVLEVRQ
jgi:hypothetical protein